MNDFEKIDVLRFSAKELNSIVDLLKERAKEKVIDIPHSEGSNTRSEKGSYIDVVSALLNVRVLRVRKKDSDMFTDPIGVIVLASRDEGKEYEASAKVIGRTYTSKGTTPYEAIYNLDVGIPKGKSILTLKKGDKEKERILMPPVTARLFTSRGSSKEIVTTSVSAMFSDL